MLLQLIPEKTFIDNFLEVKIKITERFMSQK